MGLLRPESFAMNEHSPPELVTSFLTTLTHYVVMLTGSFGLQQGHEGLRLFVESTWRGERPRSGRAGDLDFLVHGRVGCRLQAPEGGEVDVEVLADGRLGFDVWRVQQFAVSLGQPPPEKAQIEKVCEELIGSRVLDRLRDHWYALPPRER